MSMRRTKELDLVRASKKFGIHECQLYMDERMLIAKAKPLKPSDCASKTLKHLEPAGAKQKHTRTNNMFLLACDDDFLQKRNKTTVLTKVKVPEKE